MEENGQLEIRVLPNGPIQIKGKFIFKDSSGNVFERNELLLCSCGGSQNMPYCDCSHKKAE